MTGWSFDESMIIGNGGFGTVYEAHGPVPGRLAAKVVPKAEGATREQLIAQEAPTSPYVVPILHVDETPNSFALFMPRADYSLRDKIGLNTTAPDAIAILTDIAEALVAIAPTVVHRDIKPDNVLYLDGNWALCDFGIARYADAATAEDTRKFSLSAAYAAPEQWRYERATSATDVYAFGVIAYELLAGERPFAGTHEELRNQHLNSVPALLPGNRKLSWIVGECLSKAPEARPTPANLLERLRRASADAATRGGTALAAAQSAVLEARATEQAQLEVERTERERRAGLVASSRLGHSALVEELVEFITDGAPATSVSRRQGGVTLTLGEASLQVSGVLESTAQSSSFDVVASAEIRLQSAGRSRSHSLYFADFAGPRSYSWFEVGFMSTMGGADFRNEPRALPPAQGLAAFGGSFGAIQLAYGVLQLDIGDLDRFVDSWAEWFGQAADGRFPQVSTLPDGPTYRPQRRS